MFEERSALEPAALSFFRLDYVRNSTMIAVCFNWLYFNFTSFQFQFVIKLGYCFNHNLLLDNDGFHSY